LLLSISQKAIDRPCLERRGLLFKTELLWGPENKEQSQVRKPEDIFPLCLSGRHPQEAVVERGKVRYRSAEKLRHQEAQAVKATVVNSPTLCGKEQSPPPVITAEPERSQPMASR
jgi:hypothetical protein